MTLQATRLPVLPPRLLMSPGQCATVPVSSDRSDGRMFLLLLKQSRRQNHQKDEGMTKLTFTKDRIKYWRQLGLPKRFVNEMSTLCSWIFLAFETNSFKANETNVETIALQQFQNCGQHTTGSSKQLSMSSPASTRRHAHNAAYRHVARRGCAPVQPNARNFSMLSIEPLAPHGLSFSLHE
jgi:hypothetical protein